MIYNIHTFSVKYVFQTFATRINFDKASVNAFAKAAFQRYSLEKVF